MDLYKSMLAYAELKEIELMPYQKQMLKAYCEGNSVVIPRQFDKRSLVDLAIDYQITKIEREKIMIQIIETNLNINNQLDNFQSRVINVESWDYVIEQFTNKDISSPIYHYDIHNRYSGTIVPRMASIENLKYNDHRLTCDILIHGNRMRIKKLIELFKENI